MRAQTLPGTPSTGSLWQPYIAPGTLHTLLGGIPLGPDMRTHRLTVIDPPALQLLRLIHSMIFLIFGDKDGGKTTLERTLYRRLARLQAGILRNQSIPMRSRINARKPEGEDGSDQTAEEEDEESEFKALSDCMRGTFVSTTEFDSVNIIHPMMGMSYADMLDTLIQACELMADKTLTGLEPLAMQVTVWKLLRDFRDITSTDVARSVALSQDESDLSAYFEGTNGDTLKAFQDELAGNPDMAARLHATMEKPSNIDKEEFRRASGNVGADLAQITHGVAGRMFRGNGNLYDIMAGEHVTIDWDKMHKKTAGLLNAMIWKYQTLNAAMRPHISINTELGTALREPMSARFYADFIKRARAFRTIEVGDTQYRSDISGLGSVGESILIGAGAQFFTRQPENDDVLNDIMQLGVSQLDAEFLTQIPVGCFGVKVPRRPMSFFQLALTASDWDYNRGNAATLSMTNRRNVWSDERFVERAQRVGITRIGAEV